MIELEPRESDPRPSAALRASRRLKARGKFLFYGSDKFYVRGTTYGTFAHEQGMGGYADLSMVDRDFAQIAQNGFNSVRTYTVPGPGFLDRAQQHGLHVMVGLPWEQHVAFLDEPSLRRRIEERVRDAVRRCSGHPAVLCYAVGNEIPAPIVRWLGRRRVERFIERLFEGVKREDPTALVTYVNYPTTEYLELPFLDIIAFNVYLEERRNLDAYLARLQNLAGDRPLLMAEVGLDSRKHGEERQAAVLDWQLRTIFESGCAGAFAFAWTDEWHRGGYAIEDWDFGLVRRDRTAKPALAAVCDAFADVPFRRDADWPRVSVIVCAFNAAATIQQCLDSLQRLDYPDFETIIVDDGSTDRTSTIVSQYGVRLITTANQGLSNARNTGLHAATGEIVAYLDSDAFPDVQWLKYLAHTFKESRHVGVGGPNIAPPGGTRIAECFDRAPGGPTHVLLSDREAEHIPGCNMAFRAKDLKAIGGFDPQLRVAGDDVDACWRLQNRGSTLGFSPGAMVWHHRRTTVRSYWKQQRGYGRAEALLERKWPEKYNAFGHLTWKGRLYGAGPPHRLFLPQRLYAGVWGSAPYQSLENEPPRQNVVSSLPLMPEWYLLTAFLAALCALGILWAPLFFSAIPLAIAMSLPLMHAGGAAKRAVLAQPVKPFEALSARCLIAFLYLLQPLARLWGRLEYGLTCWRTPATLRLHRAMPARYEFWSERWHSPSSWIRALEMNLRRRKIATAIGGEYDRWDLEVRAGALASARVLSAIEEHGASRQLARFRTWPVCSTAGVALTGIFVMLALGAALDHAWAACAVVGAVAFGVALRMLQECASAMCRLDAALQHLFPDAERMDVHRAKA